MKTTIPFVNCTNCQKEIDYYYTDLHYKGLVCVECLVKVHNNSFPKGKGCYLPCKLCTPPNINWYHEETFGKEKKDCGNHCDKYSLIGHNKYSTRDDGDDDKDNGDSGFNLF